MSPAKIRGLLESGLAHHNAGRRPEAETLYRQVLGAAPRNFDALHLLGLAALQDGRYAAATELLRRALKVTPTSAVCELRLGAALLATGSAAAAEPYLRRATERAPALPEAWFHLGLAHQALGSAGPARDALERALRQRADYPEALEHLGALVSRTEGYAAAVPLLRRRAELQPDHPEALANLGVALAQTPEREQALAILDRALELDPANAQALTGRALVLQETYRVQEAVDCYGRAIAANPANFEARSGRLFSLHYLDGISRKELREEHAAYAASLPPAPPFAGRNLPDPGRRLRVGFLSPDLRAHSVAYFLEPLLRHLDPLQFETFLYHDHPRLDAVSARFRAGAGGWRHVAPLPAAALESVIRADEPDIMVDLAGHTGLNRLPLFARRLEPVQVTYLGYPDTTGIRGMDHRLVDAITDPVGEAEEFNSEALCRYAPTAWSYAPPESAPAPAPVPSVAAGHVTFGCFNNFSKVSDSTLRCWAHLLRDVPGSRLLLKWHGLATPAIAPRLRARLAAFGLDPGRIELADRSPDVATHLGLYARVDVALDTTPYHGTTTTCEALWMGVPVVTLRGDRHCSRVGASLLAAADHPEWVAGSPDDYVRLAAGLAADAAGRASWRTGLRHDLARGPLLDHAGQAARFGAALRGFWAQWCGARLRAAASDQPISLIRAAGEPIQEADHALRRLSA